MNRRPSGSIPVNKAIVGFVNYKYAEGLTKRSVDSYERILYRWIGHMGDKEVVDVSQKELREYLIWLRTKYQPVRFNGEVHPLSQKTLNLLCRKFCNTVPVILKIDENNMRVNKIVTINLFFGVQQ